MTTLLGIGQTVHYRAHGSADGRYPQTCRAAIVTERKGAFCASLAVLNPTGLFFAQDATHVGRGEIPSGGTWHHPEECPDVPGNACTCGRIKQFGHPACCDPETGKGTD